MRRALFTFALAVLAGCGDDSGAKKEVPKPDKVEGAVAAPPPGVERVVSSAQVTTAVAAGPAKVDPAREAILTEVRKRGFRNEDFAESDTNRDPFRSFLAEFSGAQKQTTQYTILMPKYSLDELKLVAIIGPPSPDFRVHSQPAVPSPLWRAMFLDPTGVGMTIQRNDHLSKADARVTRIAEDRVYVELKEDVGSGKVRTIERVLELHAGEQLPEVGP